MNVADSTAAVPQPSLNMALARALGCTDPARLSKVVLVIEAGTLPTVTATHYVDQPDGLLQAVSEWRLVPQTTSEEARDAA